VQSGAFPSPCHCRCRFCPNHNLPWLVRDPCYTDTPSLCWRLQYIQDRSSHGAASRRQLGGCNACCINVGLEKTCASFLSPKVTTTMTSPVQRKVAETVAARTIRVSAIKAGSGHATPCLRVNMCVFAYPRACPLGGSREGVHGDEVHGPVRRPRALPSTLLFPDVICNGP
jgi:hypothetical protein